MFKGSLVAMVTPMHDNGAVDWDSLKKLVEFHISAGTDGIVSVGTSGESATLEPTEHMAVVEKTLEYAAGRIPIIAGTGANSTSEALHLTSSAAKLGVAGCLLVVPYYNKPTQQGLIKHFSLLADSVDVPQILYNVPGRTVLDMENDTVVTLAAHPNIVGIKDATGEIDRVADMKQRCGKDFVVLSGDDGTTLALLKAGGDGCISVTANIAPAQMHEMCAAVFAGEVDKAEAINDVLNDLHSGLFIESNPIPVKWAVSELGFGGAGIRLPLTPFSEELRPALLKKMRAAGLLPA